jgi:hypothetical protein
MSWNCLNTAAFKELMLLTESPLQAYRLASDLVACKSNRLQTEFSVATNRNMKLAE